MRLYASDECGADGYPPEWHETIKHAVREAAGHRCVRCGHPYERGAGEWSRCDPRCTHGGPLRLYVPCGELVHVIYEEAPTDAAGAIALPPGPVVEARWRILTVHHLDGEKANCRWWNLAALCQRCHLQIQGKVEMRRRWLHEHSEWFKPYVAGYYAFTYLGEELGREEVEVRLEELLALESRQLHLGAAG